jgi:3-octaprenyl-4-hydroxybenzoate carboxy-lyase
MIMRSSQLMGGVCLDAKENGQIGGSDVVWDATDAGKATSKAQISYDFSKAPPSASSFAVLEFICWGIPAYFRCGRRGQGMFEDLREFIEGADRLGQCKTIDGAHWDLEIGLITEWQAGLAGSPMLLFDNIAGYPRGYRVAANIFSNNLRVSLGLGLPPDATIMEQVKLWRDREKSLKPLPPVEVDSGPVMENVQTGDDVDLFKFPVPNPHYAAL